jgi:hypothetical protein
VEALIFTRKEYGYPNTGLTTIDVLAIIGAVTGVIGTIAGVAALAWDYYKWRYSERVQLKVTAIPNRNSMSSHEPFRAEVDLSQIKELKK